MRSVWLGFLGVLIAWLAVVPAQAGEMEWGVLPGSHIEIVPGTVVGSAGEDLVVVQGKHVRTLTSTSATHKLDTAAGNALAISGGGLLLSDGGDVVFRTVAGDQKLPTLPDGEHAQWAAKSGDTLFVATRSGVWTPGPDAASGWTQVAPWPGGFEPRALACQSDGDTRRLYAFGKTQTLRLDQRRGEWLTRAPLPEPLPEGSTPISVGASNILFVLPAAVDAAGDASGGKAQKGGWSYHTITDTWAPLSDLPRGIGAVARGDGSLLILSPAGDLWSGRRPAVHSRFGWMDYSALIGYPLALLAMSLLFRVKSTDDEAYFRGSQQIPWWAAGLSLVATQVSAIGFMAIPAKSFATDWVYFAGVSMWFIVVPLVTRVYIPAFRQLNVTTAYEYLESRFNYPMRVFASLMFVVMQVSRAAIVLYLPALALSAVSGIDRVWCVLAMGLISTVYTLWGGMEAVIWTDVVQAATLLGGVLLCLVLVLVNVGGIGPFFATAAADHKFNMVGQGYSISGPALWVVLVGNVFSRLASLTSNQTVVQRYQATSSNREAARALWADVALSIPWAIMIYAMGTALYVFYKHNPGLIDPGMETDQVVPLFIAQRVPRGVAGLIIAAIFAASLDGGQLSVATAFVNDVYARMKPRATARQKVILARFLTLGLGVFSTATALLLATSNVLSLLDESTAWTGLFAGGFAGLFILGLFTRRVGPAAAFTGVLASAGVMYFVQTSGRVSVLIYSGFGVVSCVAVGWGASFLMPRRRGERAPVGVEASRVEVVV